MDTLKTALITIFKNQNPCRILANYFAIDSQDCDNHKKLNKTIFLDLYQEEDKQYSKDEVKNIYEIVQQEMKDSRGKKGIGTSVFNIIINYSYGKLQNEGNNIKCIYKELLKWRVTTLQLDQDMFIAAYLAYEDSLIGRRRNHFDWDTTIKSNNIRLHNMLSRGMAENHFHLKGSAPTFRLSWVSMMNSLECRNNLDLSRQSSRLQKDKDGNLDMEQLMIIAALLRIILFNTGLVSEGRGARRESWKKEDQKWMNILKEILGSSSKGTYFSKDMQNIVPSKELINYYSREIQSEIDTLRYIWGAIIVYKNKEVKIDYALDRNIVKEDRATKLFSGERAFLYNCFKALYNGDKDMVMKADLFYAYLIIKNKIRGELIQQNNRVGFTNFGEYQDRKTKYIKENSPLKLAIEPTAILSSIKNQNIISLEARIIPDMNSKKNVKWIKDTDTLICTQIYNDRDNCWRREEEKNKVDKNKKSLSIQQWKLLGSELENREISQLKDKYFYVYHFPKEPDLLQEEGWGNELMVYSKCRHQDYRNKLKKWGRAIYEMREKNQEVAQRVLGIDACANELVTRPEVYGQVFRYLKGHLPSHDYQRENNMGNSIPRLKATYHVGEDFLDIIDGLRAVDEAITFLNLTYGDRLGHAIVLGIDIDEWYRKKGNRLYLSKQDLLDNIAWLMCKIKEYKISGGTKAIDVLEDDYNQYYIDIYINTSKKVNKSSNSFCEEYNRNYVIPVDTYMKAWELRGDNPEAYDNEFKYVENTTYWNRCATRKDVNIPKSDVVKEIYRRYHYDPEVKREGAKKEVYRIRPYIIDIIKQVQSHMQKSIRQKGIGIECNPSSNVLISNFERYDRHPILNFYNIGLKPRLDYEEDYSQLFVSINTDDQGVFDTLLENEYALMAIALEKVKDKEGKSMYNQTDIYKWLNDIRQMGLEQSFRIDTNLSNRY